VSLSMAHSLTRAVRNVTDPTDESFWYGGEDRMESIRCWLGWGERACRSLGGAQMQFLQAQHASSCVAFNCPKSLCGVVLANCQSVPVVPSSKITPRTTRDEDIGGCTGGAEQIGRRKVFLVPTLVNNHRVFALTLKKDSAI